MEEGKRGCPGPTRGSNEERNRLYKSRMHDVMAVVQNNHGLLLPGVFLHTSALKTTTRRA